MGLLLVIIVPDSISGKKKEKSHTELRNMLALGCGIITHVYVTPHSMKPQSGVFFSFDSHNKAAMQVRRRSCPWFYKWGMFSLWR